MLDVLAYKYMLISYFSLFLLYITANDDVFMFRNVNMDTVRVSKLLPIDGNQGMHFAIFFKIMDIERFEIFSR